MHESESLLFFFCSATSRRDGGIAVVISKLAYFEDVNVEENVKLLSRHSFREYAHDARILRVTRVSCNARVHRRIIYKRGNVSLGLKKLD